MMLMRRLLRRSSAGGGSYLRLLQLVLLLMLSVVILILPLHLGSSATPPLRNNPSSVPGSSSSARLVKKKAPPTTYASSTSHARIANTISDEGRGHNFSELYHEHEHERYLIRDLCTLSNVFDGEWHYQEQESPPTSLSSAAAAATTTTTSTGTTGGVTSLRNAAGEKMEEDRRRRQMHNNPYANCPNTMKKLENTSLFDQIEKFSCFDKSYVHAHFKPKSCHLLSLKYSMQYYHKYLAHNQLIYVGDSLMGQQYISSLCYSEMSHVNLSYEHLGYIHDIFLRDDIPCHDNCTTDKAYLEFYDQTFFNPCWACRDGVRKNFSTFMERRTSENWFLNLTTNTKYLVIGSGAWYNVFKGVMNSTLSYIETLNMVGPLIGPKYSKDGAKAFWLDLPPVIFNRTADDDHNNSNSKSKYKESFEWFQYAEKNEMAKRTLSPYGFSYLDTGAATRARKAKDANVTADGVHWCNPGVSAVPTFINQVIFHLIVADHIKSNSNKNKPPLKSKNSHF